MLRAQYSHSISAGLLRVVPPLRQLTVAGPEHQPASSPSSLQRAVLELEGSAARAPRFYWDWEKGGMTPASAAVTDWGWVTVAAGREADEGRPMTMAYPHHPRPVYNSGTSAASCSEASPNGNPCPIRTVIKPRLPSLSPRRCAMSGGRVR
jgi:hypothetical protein